MHRAVLYTLSLNLSAVCIRELFLFRYSTKLTLAKTTSHISLHSARYVDENSQYRRGEPGVLSQRLYDALTNLCAPALLARTPAHFQTRRKENECCPLRLFLPRAHSSNKSMRLQPDRPRMRERKKKKNHLRACLRRTPTSLGRRRRFL